MRILLAGMLLLFAYPALAEAVNPVPFNNTGSAETFIRDLYAHYDLGEAASPDLQRRDADVLAAPELLALIKRDHELVPDEVGAYDGDPICGCQDNEGMVLRAVTITNETNNTANAEVRLDFTNSNGQYDIRDFSLVKLNGMWRIQNIVSKTEDDDTLKIFHWGVHFEETHPE